MLENLTFSKLTHLESGQHVKNVHQNLTTISGITDNNFLHYMTVVKNSSDSFDASLVYIGKSDETAKIVAADLARDYALSTLKRAASVYEFSLIDAEQLAFTSLDNLFVNYPDMQNWNYNAETNGIDNLLNDFQKPNYAPHIVLLGLADFVDRLESANTAFKALFQGRSIETAGKPSFDAIKLRKSMHKAYDDLTGYVLTMSKVPNPQPQFTTALGLINTERKYYSDLLARRSGGSGKTPPPPTS